MSQCLAKLGNKPLQVTYTCIILLSHRLDRLQQSWLWWWVTEYQDANAVYYHKSGPLRTEVCRLGSTTMVGMSMLTQSENINNLLIWQYTNSCKCVNKFSQGNLFWKGANLSPIKLILLFRTVSASLTNRFLHCTLTRQIHKTAPKLRFQAKYCFFWFDLNFYCSTHRIITLLKNISTGSAPDEELSYLSLADTSGTMNQQVIWISPGNQRLKNQ